MFIHNFQYEQVQLLSNEKLIEKLTEELQEYCNNTQSLYATINDLLNCGTQYFAVNYNGLWYRGKLLDVKGQVMFTVYND